MMGICYTKRLHVFFNSVTDFNISFQIMAIRYNDIKYHPKKH